VSTSPSTVAVPLHLFKATTWLNTAPLRTESLGLLWGCQPESGARAFVLRWQPRRTSNETCAARIDRHWNGIASYGYPENTASLGLVEGRNNKIRALQRQAYGSRDVAYRTLTIVAAFRLP